MKIRKYVKKDIIKVTSILILLLGLLTILYLSEIQSISGYVVQINYPNNIAIKDEFENVYWIKPFGDFEDKYEIGEEVKVYYYPNSEDGSNENTLSHSIVFSRWCCYLWRRQLNQS